ncbi:MAG: IS3 family transposase [Nitrospira sp.]|nr:IS3 family transposase [Nitrospira sp.]MDF0674601.1 IS3 family transposase [Nitrospira sp.]
MERVPRQKYTKEFREQAVQLVLEQDLTTLEAARRLAISDKTLGNWVCRARRGQLATLGESRRPVTELEAEVSRLKRDLAEARMERDILKKATAYFGEGAAARYALMRTLRPHYPLSLWCRVLEVSRSGYHAWQNRRPSKRAQENARLEVAIQAAHVRTRQTYGPERLQAELREDGFPAGIGRIKRLRKKLGLRCTQVRRFTITTDSAHQWPVADNLLAQTFPATRPNETWVTDITYVPTGEGWLYLAGLKDLYTCEVVGHAMGARMTTDLVRHALVRAVWGKRPRPGLIHHSDRGSQYCAQDYQEQLRQFGLTPSMSRKGNCYDNAPMESFWGTLKNELIHHRRYATREQARREITEYIELFYNRQRRHSRLGNCSPAAFAQRWARQQPAA